MYQYKGLEDTIAAIATPAGQGAIGIVRISGDKAIAVADAVLRFQGGKTLAQSVSRMVRYGKAVDADSGEVLDDVLVTLMKGPKSYTAEDVVEINCHGGITVIDQVLQAVLAAGARLATPGEFTKRAFLHGRIDLSQAEAVMDIIHAKTEAFLRQSHHQLKGELSLQLNSIREELIKLYISLEALSTFRRMALTPKAAGKYRTASASRRVAWPNFWEHPPAGGSLKKAYALSYAASPMWASLPCLIPCSKKSGP